MTKFISYEEALANGFKRYYEGRACAQGHVCEWYVKEKRCIQCRLDNSHRYYHAHTEMAARYQRARRSTPEFRRQNRKYFSEYNIRRRLSDPSYKLARNLRKRVWDAPKGNPRPQRTIEALGAPMDIVRAHLERMFSKGMSWQNYGSVWVVDHIRPLSSFDLTDPEQFAEAGHYLNLRPLASRRNLEKFNKRELLL